MSTQNCLRQGFFNVLDIGVESGVCTVKMAGERKRFFVFRYRALTIGVARCTLDVVRGENGLYWGSVFYCLTIEDYICVLVYILYFGKMMRWVCGM